MRRNAASPADVLRLLKQPVGLTREAVRAADYMDHAIIHLEGSLGRRRKRSTSTNTTGNGLTLRTIVTKCHVGDIWPKVV